MRYILVDSANTFYRARHSASRSSTLQERTGFAIHVTLTSIAKACRDFAADHVCICLEGRSWRRDFYTPYKRNRVENRAQATPAEQAEDQAFWTAHDQLAEFFQNHTNCSVLQHPQLEADDLIAGWIQNHPSDHHVIISSDSDYLQLLAPNVHQYNGVTGELTTLDGVFDSRGKPVLDRKTREPKPAPDPQWLLFEKCMRGDATDNVFSAYPGVRTRSTRNRVGLTEAFADRESRGWAWNNLMLQRWVDHLGQEHRVLDDYNRNRILVDLTAQPDEIRHLITQTVQDVKPLNRALIGAHFLKFCGRHELTRLSEQADSVANILSKPYPGGVK